MPVPLAGPIVIWLPGSPAQLPEKTRPEITPETFTVSGLPEHSVDTTVTTMLSPVVREMVVTEAIPGPVEGGRDAMNAALSAAVINRLCGAERLIDDSGTVGTPLSHPLTDMRVTARIAKPGDTDFRRLICRSPNG